MAVIPMAVGDSSPVWPLPAVTRKRWTFGARRARGKRKHAGVDLYAQRGSVVLAPENGTVVALQKFTGPRAHALLFQTDSGIVILFGEVEPGSWGNFMNRIGTWVEKGEPLAKVGINPGGDQMLHVEMYDQGTRRNHRWYPDQPPPAQLLDPTQYLQAAAALEGQTDPGDDVVDDLDDQGDDDHGQDDGTVDDQVDDPVDPDDPVRPTLPTLPTLPDIRPPQQGLGFGAAIGLFLLLAAVEDM